MGWTQCIKTTGESTVDVFVYWFVIIPPGVECGPNLEVMQYQDNPWAGWSKLQHHALCSKIRMKYRGNESFPSQISPWEEQILHLILAQRAEKRYLRRSSGSLSRDTPFKCVCSLAHRALVELGYTRHKSKRNRDNLNRTKSLGISIGIVLLVLLNSPPLHIFFNTQNFFFFFFIFFLNWNNNWNKNCNNKRYNNWNNNWNKN